MSVTYPLDLTGSAETNQISNELHEFSVSADRVFVPAAGPFYTEGLVLRDSVSQVQLQPGTQYKALWLNADAVMASGKEVCQTIFVTDLAVGGVTVSYQCVGGPHTATIDAIQQVLDALDTENLDTVPWGQILDRPAQFAPVEHLHHSRDLFGMQELSAQLEAVRVALLYGDQGTLQAIYQYIDSRLGEKAGQADILALQDALSGLIETHKAEVAAHNKSQVGLGSVENFGLASNSEANGGLSNVKYTTPNGAARASLGATRHVGSYDVNPNTVARPMQIITHSNCPTGAAGVTAGDRFAVFTVFRTATAEAENSVSNYRGQFALALANNAGPIYGLYKRTYNEPTWSSWAAIDGMRYLTVENLNNVVDTGEYLQSCVVSSAGTFTPATLQALNYPVETTLGTPTFAYVGMFSVVKYDDGRITQTLRSTKSPEGEDRVIYQTRTRVGGVWSAWVKRPIAEPSTRVTTSDNTNTVAYITPQQLHTFAGALAEENSAVSIDREVLRLNLDTDGAHSFLAGKIITKMHGPNLGRTVYYTTQDAYMNWLTVDRDQTAVTMNPLVTENVLPGVNYIANDTGSSVLACSLARINDDCSLVMVALTGDRVRLCVARHVYDYNTTQDNWWVTVDTTNLDTQAYASYGFDLINVIQNDNAAFEGDIAYMSWNNSLNRPSLRVKRIRIPHSGAWESFLTTEYQNFSRSRVSGTHSTLATSDTLFNDLIDHGQPYSSGNQSLNLINFGLDPKDPAQLTRRVAISCGWTKSVQVVNYNPTTGTLSRNGTYYLALGTTNLTSLGGPALDLWATRIARIGKNTLLHLRGATNGYPGWGNSIRAMIHRLNGTIVHQEGNLIWPHTVGINYPQSLVALGSNYALSYHNGGGAGHHIKLIKLNYAPTFGARLHD